MLSKKKAIFHAVSFVLISSFSNFSLAFKPTANHGHAGITQEGLAIVERAAESGESLRFTDEAILEVREANAGVDKGIIFSNAGEFDDPVAHCDDELLVRCSTRIRQIRDNVISNLSNESSRNGEEARRELGRALHTLQDFYSHSNWVNNPGPNNANFNDKLGREIIFPIFISETACVDNFSDGTLAGAGLTGLTTGYFSLSLGGFEPPEDKCAHGVLPGAGIHKDSPGRDHHDDARARAVEATTDLVEQILEANGIKGNDDAIRALMGIRGSVGFAIDNTGSMGPEISGVASSVTQIINSLNSSEERPDNYVLVQFGDPIVGNAFKTTSPEALLSTINSISPNGGGDCPELSQGGLLRALEAVDTGSTIYLFTDATAKDPGLVGNVIATATQKSIKINYFVSGSCSPIDPVYYAGARNTGGQAFVISENETQESFNLIEPSLTTSLESIALIDDELSNEVSTYNFPIDSSVESLLISISAETLTSVSVKGPGATPIDITSPDISITNITNGKIIKIDTPTPGKWSVTTQANGTLSISIQGDTSIRLADFNYVEESGRLEHEGFFAIEGQPVLNRSTLSRAIITGEFGSESQFSRHTPSGEFIDILTSGAGSEPQLDDTFIFNQEIDSEPHRVVFRALGEKGNIIQRVYEPILQGQSIEISLQADTAALNQGEDTTIELSVTNHGAAGSFSLRATDTQGFLISSSLINLQLKSGETETISVVISIPQETEVNSTTVSLYVNNISNPEQFNSATVAVEILSEPEFTPRLLALESLKLSHRASVDYGDGVSIFVGKNLILEHDSIIKGDLIVDGSVTLFDRAVIDGPLLYSGSISLQHGASIDGASQQGPVSLPDIEGRSVPVGPDNVTAARDTTRNLSPGSYNVAVIEERAVLNLMPGEYNFSNLEVRHGSKINIVGSDGEVIINSQGPVTVGNMSVVNPEDSKRITVYSNTDQEIYIGHDSSFEGILIAPHGKVVIASRAKAGYIEARHIELQADAQLSGN